MRWTPPRPCAAAVLLFALHGGCVSERIVEVREITSETPIPMAIRGGDAVIRLSFPRGDQSIEPGQFQPGEICYLTVGDFRIDCFTDGSSLNLGNDTTDLLTDNPMSGLEPAHDDKIAAQSMKLYGILFLVGSSVDRLPGTLADYIQNPGQHGNEAISLAQLLLSRPRIDLQGRAQGGSFEVSMELTDAARDKLIDALDEAGEPTSPIQNVTWQPSAPPVHKSIRR